MDPRSILGAGSADALARHWLPRVDLPEGEPFDFPFPLLVTGVTKIWDEDPRHPAGIVPRGLCEVEHQYAGTSCANAAWTGFVLRPPADVLAPLASLASAVRGGSGEAIDEAGLAHFSAATAACFPGLRWREGYEGLVVASAWETMPVLFGLEVLSFTRKIPLEEDRYEPAWCADDWHVDVVGRFGPEHERAFDDLARHRTLTSHWETLLLWANSD